VSWLEGDQDAEGGCEGDIVWVEDLGVFDAETGFAIGIGKNGAEDLEYETVCEVAYCVDIDLEVNFVPLGSAKVRTR
jgi:hypothetical protein